MTPAPTAVPHRRSADFGNPHAAAQRPPSSPGLSTSVDLADNSDVECGVQCTQEAQSPSSPVDVDGTACTGADEGADEETCLRDGSAACRDRERRLRTSN